MSDTSADGADGADAVVVGAGPNGLVAANLLADAGWSVVLLEAQPEVGGAVRSDRELDPAFVHDTFSAFYPLGAASPVISGLGLEAHGLRWTRAPAVLGHPLPDGSWAMVYDDVDDTCAALERHATGDGDRWRELYDDWQQIGRPLVDALMSPFPPIRAGLRTLAKLPRVGGLGYVRSLLEPAGRLAEGRFASQAGRLLIAGNAGHSDIPLDAPGSGLMAVLMAMLAQTVGFPVPEGGAGELTQAMARRFASNGGDIRCGSRVTSILVRDRRARGVVLESGEVVRAGRAVLADVVAPRLYGGLVGWEDLPPRTRQDMQRFQLDPGTVKVDWALDRPIPWTSPPDRMPGTVHVADSTDQLISSLQQIDVHTVPAQPFLLAGQMTTTDPSRSPAGTESFWAYTHVPQEIHADAGHEDITGAWDHDEGERMADRIQRQIEKHAPDFASAITARRVLTPPELERRDESLVGGALGGGTAELHQQLVLRPIPGMGRAETPVRGLFLASASAHPGGGVHGAAGSNAARAALAAARLGRLRR